MIIKAISLIAREQNVALSQLTDDLPLRDQGPRFTRVCYPGRTGL